MKENDSMHIDLIVASCVPIVLMIILFIGSFIKVASITDTKYSTVHAKIIDAEYNTSFTTYGNGLYDSSDNYATYLEYNGSIYTLSDSKTYHECRDKIGEFIEVELI